MKTLNEFIWDEDGVVQEDDEDAGTMAMTTPCIAMCCGGGNSFICYAPSSLTGCFGPICP